MSHFFRTLALRALAACSVLFVLPFRSDLALVAIIVILFGALCLLGVKYSRGFSVSLSLAVLVSVVISNLWYYCWLMVGWFGLFTYIGGSRWRTLLRLATSGDVFDHGGTDRSRSDSSSEQNDATT